MTTDAASMRNTARVAAVSDTFLHLLCFVCRDVLDPGSTTGRDTPAEHVWIGGPPKFLAVLLCDVHLATWLAEANISPDAHHWPTTLAALARP